jgi:hypothetical protein
MNSTYLGDSYDFVKGTLLHWLRPLGEWWVHPMFSKPFDENEIEQYQKLLRAPPISSGVVPAGPSGKAFIELSHRAGNVLFDPDTGLRLHGPGKPAYRYLRADELLNRARAQPSSVTAVFDQSLSYGHAQDGLQMKVNALNAGDIACFAYYSHACFIFVSANRERLDFARALLLQAGVPEWRLLGAAA